MAKLALCAETYNWTHDYMLTMKNRIFSRYVGIVLKRRILEHEEMEKQQKEIKKERRKSQPRNWKQF